MRTQLRRLARLAATRLDAGARALRRFARGAAAAERTLVIGGVRSGKSRHAERLLSRHHQVTYLAAGHQDPARLAALRSRLPAGWLVRELGDTSDLAAALHTATGPVLIECLGTWLGRVLDEVGARRAAEGWEYRLDERLLEFLQAWSQTRHPAVAVTNDVGSGMEPESATARLFRDVLGTLNTQVSAHADAVHLMVAGRVLELG
ncbi:adenosylcobinamide kinase/adenosylcobinamide phosphate guanyltransferase [Amycolatopsis suaedae]|uniref:Adenosylcobinamide kinase n=2 Tax=Amycolatopsis suaedae TaxID=2510978 RepID=A0A4Q7IYC8_9PSEU|nr:bifunctional adenosylcobinamide kinase/adenosylcobinamide-phosphate guanylyltransferase [Amycolatopsis suaedae]RZQ59449.1 adenosylcobinamide kinase/adenosylcobinamide phosphate guanyltransferase [Amycolatopsis suaedae]